MSEKKDENKPGGPGDRHQVEQVNIKVDNQSITVKTIDGEASVGDIIDAVGGNAAEDEIGIAGKDGVRWKGDQKIPVHSGMDFMLYDGDKKKRTVS